MPTTILPKIFLCSQWCLKFLHYFSILNDVYYLENSLEITSDAFLKNSPNMFLRVLSNVLLIWSKVICICDVCSLEEGWDLSNKWQCEGMWWWETKESRKTQFKTLLWISLNSDFSFTSERMKIYIPRNILKIISFLE